MRLRLRLRLRARGGLLGLFNGRQGWGGHANAPAVASMRGATAFASVFLPLLLLPLTISLGSFCIVTRLSAAALTVGSSGSCCFLTARLAFVDCWVERRVSLCAITDRVSVEMNCDCMA